ncbi:MAG: hypothetical protein AAF629_30665 [Chloroflexota bacterium]
MQQEIDNLVFQDIDFVVEVSGQYSLEILIEITDALLATPVPAMAVRLDSLDVADKIIEIQARSGSHMKVGIRQITSPRLNKDVVCCTTTDFLLASHYVEPNHKSTSKNLSFINLNRHWRQAVLRPAIDLSSIDNLKQMASHFNLLLDVTAFDYRQLIKQMPTLINIGGKCLIVGQAIVYGAEPDMATIISQARHLQSSWRQPSV